MSLNLRDIVGDIFHTEEREKAEEAQKQADLLNKVNATYGIKDAVSGNNNTFNPFLKKDGSLFNPYIDYQKVLDNPDVSQVAKNYITRATGLTPSVNVTPTVNSVSPTETATTNVPINSAKSYESYTEQSSNKPQATTSPNTSSGSGTYTNSVGKRIANTASYNNNAAKGQCVWYVRGRAKEKLGFDPGALGNGNEMWYNAKSESKLAPTVENVKPNTILSYKYGTSSAGQKYGHVIFIEDVVGDTVYYTEGGSGYYKNGTDGVVKTATRQQILNGTNSSGGKIGSGAVGLIDLSKY